MWLFLYYITGIPFSEQQSLAHRGENYKAYQRRTSMFIQWPPQRVGKYMDFMIQQSLKLVEKGKSPDAVIRAGIRTLSKKRLAQEGRFDPALAAQRYMDVLHMLKNSAIAIETDKANEQHYELPTAFFQAVLGKQLKYSASLLNMTIPHWIRRKKPHWPAIASVRNYRTGRIFWKLAVAGAHSVCIWPSIILTPGLP